MRETEELAARRIEVADLIRRARESGRRPRVHPNGFVQLDLDESGALRLHIWPEEGRVQKQATDHPIHDHIFDMRSTVLRGRLGQQLYKFDLMHGGDPTHAIYVATTPTGRNRENTLVPSNVLVRGGPIQCVEEGAVFIDTTYTAPVLEGESYDQPAFTFHDTIIWERPVVTVMEKTRGYQGSPRVMVPLPIESVDNDFLREGASAEDLWNLVDEVTAW